MYIEINGSCIYINWTKGLNVYRMLLYRRAVASESEKRNFFFPILQVLEVNGYQKVERRYRKFWRTGAFPRNIFQTWNIFTNTLIKKNSLVFNPWDQHLRWRSLNKLLITFSQDFRCYLRFWTSLSVTPIKYRFNKNVASHVTRLYLNRFHR